MKVKDEKGYSLVEVLVVIAILAVVGGAICGFLLTSTRLFSGSKNEVDIQTEAQTAINWLNDMLAEAGYGVMYKEDAVAGSHVLEIYNAENIYTVTWKEAEETIYCDESRFEADGSIVRVTADEENMLAEYVTGFTVDTSGVTEEKPVVVITLKMEKQGRSIELVRHVSMRNGVMIDRPVEEVYAGRGTIVSSVTGVIVYPKESYLAKGGTAQFTARVTGVGFPSQKVTWSIPDRTGLHPDTTIDEQTGTLTISPLETASYFRVAATSVETDTEGNRVSSTDTSGIVRLMTITDVEIVNVPAGKQNVGAVLPLIALVHGENMDEYGQRVTWTIPEEFRKEGLSVNADGIVVLGMGLYNAFPSAQDKENATVTVRAVSVADPSKYRDCTISLAFGDMDLSFDQLTYTADRNDYLDLRAKLQAGGITSRDMKLVWSMVNDAGLGNKVSLDTAMGVLTVSKDIDYEKEYTLELQVSLIASGTQEAAAVKTVKVVIPKVSINFASPTCQVVKGTSEQMAFTVSGLKAEAADMQVTSTPAVRNTLLYVQGNSLVVSLGKDISREQFDVKLSLRGHAGISTDGTVLVMQEVLSDDEIGSIINVEDVYLHVPVPGEERQAPTLDEVKAGKTIQINGISVSYSYDNARGRCKVKIGDSGSSYFYADVAGSNIVWYKSNSDGSNGSAFYAPVPGEGAFPSRFSGGSAEIVYKGSTIQYKQYLESNYITPGAAAVLVYQVYDPETGKWFQYNEIQKIWQSADRINRSLAGSASASSSLGDNQAGRAIDGNRSTRWESVHAEAQSYITIDLGSVYRVDSIKLIWENARAANYDIQVSNDGNTWSTIGNYNWTQGVYEDTVTPGSLLVRYVRIKGNTKVLGYGYSLYEVEIMGAGY